MTSLADSAQKIGDIVSSFKPSPSGTICSRSTPRSKPPASAKRAAASPWSLPKSNRWRCRPPRRRRPSADKSSPCRFDDGRGGVDSAHHPAHARNPALCDRRRGVDRAARRRDQQYLLERRQRGAGDADDGGSAQRRCRRCLADAHVRRGRARCLAIGRSGSRPICAATSRTSSPARGVTLVHDPIRLIGSWTKCLIGA
jgi:hypothetical protein